jgi:type VI protein secretion system component Hcp
LDGIAGESTLKGLESWIELSDFSWGAQDTLPAPTAGGTGTGKVTALAVSFSAPTSKATPLLLGSTVTGKHIKTGKLVVTRSVASGLIQFIKIDLTDVVIDYLKIDTPSAGIPTDRGNLVFSKIKFAYYPQDPKGGLSTPVSVEWDTRTNKV